METKLERIADKSRNEKQPIFTSLYHLINEELLKQCHKELDGSKAEGIDNVNKKEYAENLEANIKELVIRLKNKAYKPAPALRVYIPKDNGKMRPLGISIYEDKIVQLALKKILEAIYEPKFQDNMYGFRANNSCHKAIKYVHKSISNRKWYKEIVEKRAKGDNFLVVYADDFIAGFQYKREAEAYYEALKNRTSKFGLELEESKSRLLEFGRYAEQNRKSRGEGKPETFDFLGFTFYCSKTRKSFFCVKVKTSKKKFKQKIKAMKVWLYENRDIRTKDLMDKLKIKLLGHYRYYGISHNSDMIGTFRHRTLEYLFKILNRRSNKRSYNWIGFNEMLKYYKLPYPKIYFSLFD